MRHLGQGLLLIGATGMVSCGADRRSAASQAPTFRATGTAGCLSQADSQRYLHRQVQLLDERANSELIESTCRKRVYQHGSHRIAIFVHAGSADGVRSIAVERPANAPLPSQHCFERAAGYLQEHLPYGRQLVAQARQRYGESWTDPDMGPRAFLHCSDDEPVASSVASMAHEINHALRTDSCSYEPTSAEPVCFRLPGDMPERRLARLPRSLLDGQHASVHHRYMVRSGGQSPVTLFDEMVAYGLNADVQGRMLVSRAAAGQPLRSRGQLWLPMFMYLSVRYVEQLRDQHPDVYRATFAPANSPNRRALRRLLDRSEQSMRRWLESLESVGAEPFGSEALFWSLYLELEPQVFPERADSVAADDRVEAADQ